MSLKSASGNHLSFSCPDESKTLPHVDPVPMTFAVYDLFASAPIFGGPNLDDLPAIEFLALARMFMSYVSLSFHPVASDLIIHDVSAHSVCIISLFVFDPILSLFFRSSVPTSLISPSGHRFSSSRSFKPCFGSFCLKSQRRFRTFQKLGVEYRRVEIKGG